MATTNHRKSSIMGNHLDFSLKISHRDNTGSYRGKRKLIKALNDRDWWQLFVVKTAKAW